MPTNYKTVEQIEKDENFQLVDRDIDLEFWRDYAVIDKEQSYSVFFVKTGNADLIELYGCIGTPWLWSSIDKLFPIKEDGQ